MHHDQFSNQNLNTLFFQIHAADIIFKIKLFKKQNKKILYQNLLKIKNERFILIIC